MKTKSLQNQIVAYSFISKLGPNPSRQIYVNMHRAPKPIESAIKLTVRRSSSAGMTVSSSWHQTGSTWYYSPYWTGSTSTAKLRWRERIEVLSWLGSSQTKNGVHSDVQKLSLVITWISESSFLQRKSIFNLTVILVTLEQILLNNIRLSTGRWVAIIVFLSI